MAKTGIIETATGYLLRWGEDASFTPGEGEEAAPTPLPDKPKRKWAPGETQVHQWNGSSAYELVAQPVRPSAPIVVAADGTKYALTVNQQGKVEATPV